MNMDVTSFDRFIVVGDRVLVKPKKADEKTRSGLFLPPGIEEKEDVRSGYIIKVGPGYPIPSAEDEEPWKDRSESVRYMPLQTREGDLAIYLARHAHEIEFNGERFCIVPQSGILLLIRDEELFS